MTRLCGLDIETTGLDWQNDHITEIGYVIKDWKDPKPLVAKSLMIKLPEGVSVSEEITQLTKITDRHLSLGGGEFEKVLAEFWYDVQRLDVEYIVAHNGENFDKPFMRGYSSRMGYAVFEDMYKQTPWLDTKEDIVYPSDIRNTSLIYVAACLGFVNPFPHAALFDAFTCLKVLEHFSLDDVIARSKEPWIVARALVKPPYNDSAPAGEKEVDKAKARRYRWQDCGSGRVYDKCWVKQIKASELVREKSEAPFKVVRIDDET